MTVKLYETNKAYLAVAGAGATGIQYNGSAAGATGYAGQGAGATGANGQGIDIRGFRKAGIYVASEGSLIGTTTVTAVVGTQPALPTDSGSTGLNGFSISEAATDARGVKVGELDLTQAPGDTLWIKTSGPTEGIQIVAVPSDPKSVPTGGVADSTFPAL